MSKTVNFIAIIIVRLNNIPVNPFLSSWCDAQQEISKKQFADFMLCMKITPKNISCFFSLSLFLSWLQMSPKTNVVNFGKITVHFMFHSWKDLEPAAPWKLKLSTFSVYFFFLVGEIGEKKNRTTLIKIFPCPDKVTTVSILLLYFSDFGR